MTTDRWKLRWQHAFFGLPLAISLTQTDPVAGSAIRPVLLAALAGWYVFWYGPWPGHADRRVAPPYLAGATGLWLALVVLDPAFWIAGLAVLAPPGMRRPAAAAFGVAACGSLWLAVRATGAALTWPEVLASALMVGAAALFLGYLAALERQARERARLLDELSAAQEGRAAAERRAGTLAERQRLAREIHDTLTQGFASIGMMLEAVQEIRGGPPAGAGHLDRHIESALCTARDNLAESRRLVRALRPAPLDGAGLPDAVRRETRRLADETGIAAVTMVTGDPAKLAEPTEAGVLRVVQEALTNARRHARPSEITVTLSYLPGGLRVDIRDDGSGMPARPPQAGMGLRSMLERAAELGGELTVESGPGEGTTIALAVPATAAAPVGAGA